MTMTEAARRPAPRRVRRRPRLGHRDPARRRATTGRRASPTDAAPGPLVVLTWGLLGPGKGIEWALDALAELQRPATPPHVPDRRRRPTPRSSSTHGEAYRDRPGSGSAAGSASASWCSSTTGTSTSPRCSASCAAADVVLLPYDSPRPGHLRRADRGRRRRASPSWRPAFPHAVELLPSGAGLLVPQATRRRSRAALRRVLDRARTRRGDGVPRRRGLAPRLLWPAVAEQLPSTSAPAADRAERCRPRDVTASPPSFDHLLRLSDDTGLFEHALGSRAPPRARLLPRRRRPGSRRDDARAAPRAEVDSARRARTCGSSSMRRPATGAFHNRRGVRPAAGRTTAGVGRLVGPRAVGARARRPPARRSRPHRAR